MEETPNLRPSLAPVFGTGGRRGETLARDPLWVRMGPNGNLSVRVKLHRL